MDKYVVEVALNMFEKLDMIERNESSIIIRNWDKMQSLDTYNHVREQNRIRKQNQREREKLALIDANKDTMSRDSHASSRDSHA